VIALSKTSQKVEGSLANKKFNGWQYWVHILQHDEEH
jgi:hypothetical protein